MPCRRLPGRSCQIATCIGHQPAHDKPANGRRSGFACAATQRSTRAMLYFKPCLPRRLALDLRENSRGWVCCRGSPPQVLSCPGQRVPLPEAPPPATPPDAGPPAAPAEPAGTTPLAADAAWYNQPPHQMHLRLGKRTAGFSFPCCMPPSAACTPMRWPPGKPTPTTPRYGSVPSTPCARLPPSTLPRWCTRCTPCSSLLLKRGGLFPWLRHKCCWLWQQSPTLYPTTRSFTYPGHGDLLHCPTDTYLPRFRKHCCTCS